MKRLQIEQLEKSYKYGVLPVLTGIDLTLDEGEICAIVGESGSGKSTLLKLIAGLETPDSGTIRIKGQAVSTRREFMPPEKRNIGFVFQDFALFPHLSVEKNVGFGIKKRAGKSERVHDLLKTVGLGAHGAKYPHELSGGEQQRVALARAMAPNPSLLLLDEPFSNLDVGLKKEIRSFLFDIIRKSALSCVFVTHDLEDAMLYADTIAILHEGQIVQKGTPETLYTTPVNAHVAGFFGELNVLSRKTVARFKLSKFDGIPCGVWAGKLKCSLEPGENRILVQVMEKAYMGTHDRLSVCTADGCCLAVEVESGVVADHAEVYLELDQTDIMRFHA
ncbi:MAG: ABC transporter ATP-binding protein [Bacteroidota bacterium]